MKKKRKMVQLGFEPSYMLLAQYNRPDGTCFDSLSDKWSHTIQTIEGLLYLKANAIHNFGLSLKQAYLFLPVGAHQTHKVGKEHATLYISCINVKIVVILILVGTL